MKRTVVQLYFWTCPELPVIDSAPAERADAARNRRRVLEAAAELFARDPECVTMEAVAAAAGVGKGTVFRRFGDRAGLVRALISDTEIELQEQLIRGAPPLGPGAPARAADRVRRARTCSSSSATAADGLGRRAVLAVSDVYALYRTHVVLLLERPVRRAAPLSRRRADGPARRADVPLPPPGPADVGRGADGGV